jgi:NADP-dependent 3-hydroxy acid dehydrogenase YdfG
MIEATISTFNKLDCICNNAAASKGLGPVENYSLEDVQATLDLTFHIVMEMPYKLRSCP